MILKYKSYKELPISDFLDYLVFCESTTNHVTKKIFFLSIITGINIDSFYKMSLTEFSEYTIPEEFSDEKLNEDIVVDLKGNFNFEYFGKKYSIDTNISDFNVGKFMDTEVVESKDVSKNLKDKILNLFSLLLVEENIEYTPKDFQLKRPFVEQLPTDIVYRAASYILKKRILLNQAFLVSTEKMESAQTMLEKMKQDLMTEGVINFQDYTD